jgi:hypothetical protein
MPSKRFDESTKAKAVRLVREHAGDYDSEWVEQARGGGALICCGLRLRGS